MSKTSIANCIYSDLKNDHGLTHKQISAVVDAVFDNIEQTLVAGGDVVLLGFGSFSTSMSPGRNMRNIQTGETIQIPPKRRLKFKASGKFKERLNA